MPYILKKQREFYKEELDELVRKLSSVNFPKGDVNFIISTIIGNAYLQRPSYDTINDMDGAVGEAAREFFRRVGTPHEKLKIEENEDIEVYKEIDKYFETK